jgi:7-cyano-7-deazaguanine synthase
MDDSSDFENSALVLFSGGQDSTTCLAWALERYERVETVGFDYGQRHNVELECRLNILDKIGSIKEGWAKRLGEDHFLDIKVLGDIGGTAMTENVAIEFEETGLPNTFVPGRNIIFFNFAAALAYRRGIKHLVGGMCETDYSGYPDCRDDTLKSLQVTLNLAMDIRFVVETPLMWIDKAATWDLANELGGANLIDLITVESHTCYIGNRSIKHDWGYGCGECPACELRKNGWEEWKA